MGGAALRGFGPVLDSGCELLVLGSFPSEASLAAGHYYAHPRNQFWPILGEVLGEPLSGLPFEERYRRVLAHRVGIWDVLGACRRQGSLDADIRDAAANDFELLARLAPGLVRVLFNGRTAGRFEPAFRRQGYETAVLPSTSPAFAGMRFEDKLRAWRTALEGPAQVPCEDARFPTFPES
ncbi:DNA-deoxyinosine glycosylase [Quisquiliibacterium transsilvanicum]